MNSSSCEDLFEFVKINFQLQEDISITKDITLQFCSYFQSFHLQNVIDDSEVILKSVSLLIYLCIVNLTHYWFPWLLSIFYSIALIRKQQLPVVYADLLMEWNCLDSVSLTHYYAPLYSTLN